MDVAVYYYSSVSEDHCMSNIIKRYFITFCLFIILVPTPAAGADEGAVDPDVSVPSFLPDRRKDQFSSSTGYALFPYPYSLPGVGKGIGLVGGVMNIANTYTDTYGLIFGGEVEGVAVGMADIHLIPRTLIFDVGYSNISKIQVMSYSERGMNTRKNDYRLLDLNNSEYFGGRMIASFFDRRLELYGGWYKGAMQLNSIRDKDGNIIVEAQDAPREWGYTTLIGSRLDFTDDYADPRRGVSLNITRSTTPPRDSGPDYYVMDYNMTAYLPIGKRSTWAFNVLRSEAIVVKKGETDPAKLQDQHGINCADPSLTPRAQQYCIEVVNNMIANNSYGTATSLGGFARLRSYSQGRYHGAHTRFYGTEIRWNLTDESTPFDIFVMKDIRTAIQLAAFYELGSTADLRSDLGNTWRKSYGIGFRLVTASGVVFRGDLAYGSDGLAQQIFIGYPWEI